MKKLALCAAAVFVGLTASDAGAQVTYYGNTSPTGNYAAFSSALGALTTLTFDTHPHVPLIPTFYPGVTLTASGAFGDNIVFGAGPGQQNITSGPLSSGEGTHPASYYLQDGGSSGALTISFDSPVFGAGFFLIDYYNPQGDTNHRFEAFTGQNGTGTSLGFFNSLAYNFQSNNEYFMGITSAAGDIGSVVFSDGRNNSGDGYGIDDITYSSSNATITPEPATLALLAPGLLAAAAFVRRRRRSV